MGGGGRIISTLNVLLGFLCLSSVFGWICVFLLRATSLHQVCFCHTHTQLSTVVFTPGVFMTLNSLGPYIPSVYVSLSVENWVFTTHPLLLLTLCQLLRLTFGSVVFFLATTSTFVFIKSNGVPYILELPVSSRHPNFLQPWHGRRSVQSQPKSKRVQRFCQEISRFLLQNVKWWIWRLSQIRRTLSELTFFLNHRNYIKSNCYSKPEMHSIPYGTNTEEWGIFCLSC